MDRPDPGYDKSMSALIDYDMVQVLHIDDNRGDLELTRAAFKDCCPEVLYRGLADPLEGLKYLGECATCGAPSPSLVVLDLNMPRIRGIDVLAFIRRHAVLNGLPVVVLTTSTRTSEVEECRRLGATAVLTKPASYDELVDLVRGMIRHLS